MHPLVWTPKHASASCITFLQKHAYLHDLVLNASQQTLSLRNGGNNAISHSNMSHNMASLKGDVIFMHVALVMNTL